MIIRFTILDRNNTAYIIEEPVGADANEAEIKRHPDWHGIFITTDGDTLVFDGMARDLLKSEYDLYGAEGEMSLLIEEDCGQGFFEFSRGKFDFNKYNHDCDEGSCYVTIPVSNITAVSELTARINQKVDLLSLKAFDEVTNLPAYPMLNFEMLLPSKGILLQNKSFNENPVTEEFLGASLFVQGPYNYSGEIGMIKIAMTKQVVAEIGAYFINPTPVYVPIKSGIQNGTGYNLPPFPQDPEVLTLPPHPTDPVHYLQNVHAWPQGASDIVNWADTTPNFQPIDITVKTDIRIKGSIEAMNVGTIDNVVLVLMTLNKDDLPTYLLRNYIYQKYVPAGPNFVQGQIRTFDSTYTNPAFVLKPGDRVYAFITIMHNKSVAQATAQTNAFKVVFDQECSWKMEYLSRTPSTTAKVFAVNESLSRIVEVITNDKLRVKSDYFGRTDSLPFPSASDGCGGLEVMTDGIRVRRQEAKVPGKISTYALSMQDALEGLNPIHNIGMGIEPDPTRPGFNRLRIEEWEYFYQPNIILSCTGINKIKRRGNDKDIFSTFQFGYSKWEAEEYNGIDEYNTSRTYRTTLNNSKNELVKLSKFVASGYSLEVTRRKGNDSKDWRYDKDTFIICVKRANSINYLVGFGDTGIIFYGILTAPSWAVVGATFTVTNAGVNNGIYTINIVAFDPSIGMGINTTPHPAQQVLFSGATITSNLISGFVPEQGNIINPANIIDPATGYNFRISPVRNALRWMNKVFASYKQFGPNTKIIFTDGDGNYFAEGELSGLLCKLEAGLVKENQTIDVATFANPATAEPLMLPERVSFDYPMSTADYQLLQQNPYGLIHFDGQCDSGEGWIDTINFRQDEGMATFTLIPKAP